MSVAHLALVAGVTAAESITAGFEWLVLRRRRRPVGAGGGHGLLAARLSAVAAGTAAILMFGPSVAFVAVPGAWVLARVRLAHRERVSRCRSESAMPGFTAAVAAALASGLRSMEALELASRHREDTLGRDASSACLRVSAGEAPEAALGRFAEAHGQRAAALVALLTSASRHGTDPTAAVAALAASARSADLAGRRERAARSAPLIQLLIALGLVPSVLLLVVAAAIAALGR